MSAVLEGLDTFDVPGRTLDEKLETIASMPTMQYERLRKGLAKKLCMRTAGLDAARAERLKAQAAQLEERARGETGFGEGADIVAEMNREHALVWIGDELRVLWRDHFEGGAPRTTTVDACKQYHRNRSGRTNPVDVWMEAPQRAEFDRIAFLPGVENPKVFNLWRGWGTKPMPGECSAFLEHLHEVIARKDERLYAYLIDWLADIAQNPGDPKGTAVALRGGQGVGKGTLFRWLEAAFAPYTTHLISTAQFTGRFNDHLAGKMLVFVDEAAWPGDRQQRGIVKGLITERRILVERKHQPAFEIENHARFLFATNESWAIPADVDDRRFLMLDVGEHRRDDTAYWSALQEEMDNGGVAALLDFLLKHQIGSNLRIAPATDALAEQKLMSLDGAGKFWRYLLMASSHVMKRGMGPDARACSLRFGVPCPTTVLHELYLEFARKMRIAHPDSIDALGRSIRRYCPSVSKREARTGELAFDPEATNRRIQVYVLPTINEARQQFGVALRQEFEWEAPEVELQW